MRPCRQRQHVFSAIVIRHLHDRLDEVLLVRLPESEPVQPTKVAQLVEFDRLARLRHHDEHAIDFLAGARPPGAAAGGVAPELLICMVGQRYPWA
jgi:hypothetical protein